MMFLFLLTITVCGVLSLDEKFEKDKQLFQSFVEETYGHDFNMDSFVEMLWPKLQLMVPITVDLPAVEVYDRETDDYMCSTNSTAQVKIGKILDKKLIFHSEKKFTYEVIAELLLGSQTVQFGVAKKLGADKSSPLVPVGYTFKEPSKVKMVIEVYNFLHQQHVLIPQCLTKLKNIMVVELSQPEPSAEITDEESRKIVEDYELSFSTRNAAIVGTIGLVKAINDNFIAKPGFWICPSMSFNNVVRGYEKEWSYSDNYYLYCLKKKKNE